MYGELDFLRLLRDDAKSVFHKTNSINGRVKLLSLPNTPFGPICRIFLTKSYILIKFVEVSSLPYLFKKIHNFTKVPLIILTHSLNINCTTLNSLGIYLEKNH